MIEAKVQSIRRASWISILGNAALSILKITVGFISGSLAVVADGIDSASDIITSIITLITAKIISKPPDVRFPYGYEKADTIASKILAFIIFFAGAQLAIATGTKLIEGEMREMPNQIAIYVTVISIVGKLLLARYQFKIGKRVNSLMLIANARNMQNDVVISISVLVGLAFTFVFKMPILDIVTAFMVSAWIMWVAIKIFMQSNTELMDGIMDTSVYKMVLEAAEEIDGVQYPHRVRIRQMNNSYVIAIDIEVDGDMSVNESHELSHQVSENIKNKIENIYDIIVHIEPLGTEDKGEKYGVSNKDFQN